MIRVHHLNNSRSTRVLWILEELGLPYEIKFYQRDPVTMLAPRELMQIHPLGKSPVITDDDLVVAESGAILEYLVNKYGAEKLRPKKESELLKYNYWMHYAEGSLMPPLVMKLVFGMMSKPPMPIFLRPVGAMIAGGFLKKFINPQIKSHLKFIEGELSHSEWFAGDQFSAADIQMSFPVEAAQRRFGFDTYPHIQKYLKKFHERPAYKRALEKGGELKL